MDEVLVGRAEVGLKSDGAMESQSCMSKRMRSDQNQYSLTERASHLQTLSA